MYDNEYFVVDMASCTSTGEIINSLSLALETLNHSGKKIILKLNDSKLNQSQMLSIQSLITSYGCTLDTVETINEDTLNVASGMNITVQKPIEKRVDETFEPKEGEQFTSFDIPLENKETFEQTFEENNPEESFDEFIKEDIEEESAIDNTSEFGDAAKNTIGVYKKAYDENEITSDAWEEVDFYETPVNEPVVSDTKETTYINQTLRSGQILESEGNVVIIGDCHPGSEIRAAGDITVWGVLSGIAHAGINGNLSAKVRALKLNAVQLRIGNCYSRRPDGTNIPYIIKSSIFTPEEARVVDGEIMLFKINQN